MKLSEYFQIWRLIVDFYRCTNCNWHGTYDSKHTCPNCGFDLRKDPRSVDDNNEN